MKFEQIASKICDCHVHYGKFHDEFYEPNLIVDWFEQLGIDKVGIMPLSTTWESDFNRDLQIISNLPKNRFVPYFWVSPEMYDEDQSLNKFDVLDFNLIKIHAYARKDWIDMPEKISGVIECAYKRNVPVMFHTGGWSGSEAINFKPFCRDYPGVNFILAHGRPIEQTILILKEYSNTYVDTSFMPIEDVKLLVLAGLSKKILFGTDIPLMKCFSPEIDVIEWYKNNIMEYVQLFGEIDFMIWANENFYKLILK